MTAAKLTEKQWLEQVRTLAKLFGWLTYHPHQSMRSEPGYPDLTLIRERRLRRVEDGAREVVRTPGEVA